MKSGAVIALISVLLLTTPYMGDANNEKIVYKKIAVYPSVVPAVKALETTMRYGWKADGRIYIFSVRQIDGVGVLAGRLKKYDVFAIGASGRQYLHGNINLWKKQVREFVANGGGYFGVCGGANEASMGYEHPSSTIDRVINGAVLGIAKVYINDDQDQEWQYLYKTGGMEGGVPVKCNLTDHPIVSASPDNPRIIRYEGGPGMYPVPGYEDEIIPLAVYGEEISDIAPIHHWYKKDGEWYMDGNITTDIKGEYAAIATRYGEGRVVIFGPHPEEITKIGGHVEEFLGRSAFKFFKQEYLYKWVGGNETPWSYNWWMIRRSIAWICGIENLPPVDELACIISIPNKFYEMIYVNGRAIMPWSKNVVIGGIDMRAYVHDAVKVSVYVDGKDINDTINPPYTWHLKMAGKHNVMVKAYGRNDDFAYDTIDILFL